MTQPASGPQRFFTELRRRRVFSTAALYILGAWVLLQVSDILLPALALPEAAIGNILYALIGVFPVVLVFGWFFDASVHGLYRTCTSEDEEAKRPLNKGDFLLLAPLLFTGALIIYGSLAGIRGTAGPEKTTPAPVNSSLPIIAVLPLETISAHEGDTIFARGIHEDLQTHLAKLGSLRVISRKSTAEYADSASSVAAIGEELGADAILDAGVQIAGEQIRVSASLIDTASGEALWAESFERRLDANNIFAVQADIARSIARALDATLTDSESDRLDIIPTQNLEAYRAYHEALAIRYGYEYDNRRDEFLAALERAVALDPDYSRAAAELAGHLAFQNFYNPDAAQVRRIEALIAHIRSIAPNSADALIAEAYYTYYIVKNYPDALRLINRAQALAPSDTAILDVKGRIQRRLGDMGGKVETTRLARQLDPRQVTWTAQIINNLIWDHQYAEALAELEQAPAVISLLPGFLTRKALARFQAHNDPRLYVQDLEAANRQFPDGQVIPELFDAYLLNRQYSNAESLLAGAPDADPARAREDQRLPEAWVAYLTLYSFSGETEKFATVMSKASALFGEFPTDQGSFTGADAYLEQALMAAFAGDSVGAQRWINGFRIYASDDLAALYGRQLEVCRILGLINSTAAVTCLEDGLTHFSMVTPFMEPLMPHFDGIREIPEFRGLVDQLETAGELETGTLNLDDL